LIYLGADAKTLPSASNWPTPLWPGDVFGWLLQVCFAANGTLNCSQTICINQQLMYGDYLAAFPPVLENNFSL
jgi:hypothetical protein